jgi:hypothetical protein
MKCKIHPANIIFWLVVSSVIFLCAYLDGGWIELGQVSIAALITLAVLAVIAVIPPMYPDM